VFSAQVVPIHSAFALVLRFTSFIARKARVECILYKVNALALEKVMDRHYGVHIPHNRIHQVLKTNLRDGSTCTNGEDTNLIRLVVL